MGRVGEKRKKGVRSDHQIQFLIFWEYNVAIYGNNEDLREKGWEECTLSKDLDMS